MRHHLHSAKLLMSKVFQQSYWPNLRAIPKVRRDRIGRAARILAMDLPRAALSEFHGTDHRLVAVYARFDSAIRLRVPQPQAPTAPRSARAPSRQIGTNKFDIARLF